MLIRLQGGTVHDPANGIEGRVMDLYIHDGRLAAAAPRGVRINRVFDLRGKIVMPGAIDIHTHIGGGKVNIARLLLPEDHDSTRTARTRLLRSGSGRAAPSTSVTGYRYAEMGFTSCFEPAMLPSNARQAHMEMADTPIVDTGAYALLGNDEFLLRQFRRRPDPGLIEDYVAWVLNATQAIGIKVVNPGGIDAFKYNQRTMDLDEKHVHYGCSPRDILLALAGALTRLGVPHPLHVHGCNLGIPGNLQTTLDTIAACEGLPMHLTHVQFHSYGKEGDRRFSSGAARIAEAVNGNPNISVDVGQIMFGQTVTASGDTMLQYRGHRHAHPDKWVCMDIECDAGCGVVPFRYRDRNFVNALQWCIGLELFLMVRDPWRIFLTTDHPNGAPFTMYPHLIHLLMDRGFRNSVLDTIHGAAREASVLPSLQREYSLQEIVIMTRAAPARILGLRTKGHLGPGADADIAVYTDRRDRTAMFSRPDLVFKGGELVARRGRICATPRADTHVVKPDFSSNIETRLRRHFERYSTVRFGNFPIQDEELLEYGHRALRVHRCGK